jgi:hypothetical protein
MIRGRLPLSARSLARSNALSQWDGLAFPCRNDIAVSETSNWPCVGFGQWMPLESPVRGNSCAGAPQIGHVVVMDEFLSKVRSLRPNERSDNDEQPLRGPAAVAAAPPAVAAAWDRAAVSALPSPLLPWMQEGPASPCAA